MDKNTKEWDLLAGAGASRSDLCRLAASWGRSLRRSRQAYLRGASCSIFRRRNWYLAYVETLVQRDVRELARISALDALSRLLQLAAGQTARLINVSNLAAPFQLSRLTIRDYVSLLERIFLLEQLPP